MVTEEEILAALRSVEDPDLRADIVSLGFVEDLRICDGHVAFKIRLTTPACPVKENLRAQAEEAVAALPGVETVKVEMTADTKALLGAQALRGVSHVVAVGAGKGGVGKSTVAVNLAVALAQSGARVGLMDSDVYGPNAPTMLGVKKPAGVTKEKKLLPAEAHGIRFVSMGFFVKPEEAVIWRGPMLHGAVRQFLYEVAWGELDYLIVDLPPGTGDVVLSLSQMIPLAGAVVVSTPQRVSIEDATKAVGMFRKVGVEVLGMIENMSGLVCPHCNERIDVFGSGTIEAVAEDLGVPYLGAVPIDPRVREGGDAGGPIAATAAAGDPVRKIFEDLAGRLAQEASKAAFARKEAPAIVT